MYMESLKCRRFTFTKKEPPMQTQPVPRCLLTFSWDRSSNSKIATFRPNMGGTCFWSPWWVEWTWEHLNMTFGKVSLIWFSIQIFEPNKSSNFITKENYGRTDPLDSMRGSRGEYSQLVFVHSHFCSSTLEPLIKRRWCKSFVTEFHKCPKSSGRFLSPKRPNIRILFRFYI